MARNTATNFLVATRIHPSQVEALDVIASERGCSRYDLMRDVLEYPEAIRAALRQHDLAERARLDARLAASDDLAAV